MKKNYKFYLSIALEAIVVLSSIIGVILSIQRENDQFMGGASTILYFTIQSNLWICFILFVLCSLKIIENKKRVIDNKGNDVTKQFEKGAQEVINLAKKLNVTKIILQPRSPSCGIGKIYSGNFDGTLIDGNGILVELCIKNGIEVINSEDL